MDQWWSKKVRYWLRSLKFLRLSWNFRKNQNKFPILKNQEVLGKKTIIEQMNYNCFVNNFKMFELSFSFRDYAINKYSFASEHLTQIRPFCCQSFKQLIVEPITEGFAQLIRLKYSFIVFNLVISLWQVSTYLIFQLNVHRWWEFINCSLIKGTITLLIIGLCVGLIPDWGEANTNVTETTTAISTTTPMLSTTTVQASTAPLVLALQDC